MAVAPRVEAERRPGDGSTSARIGRGRGRRGDVGRGVGEGRRAPSRRRRPELLKMKLRRALGDAEVPKAAACNIPILKMRGN